MSRKLSAKNIVLLCAAALLVINIITAAVRTAKTPDGGSAVQSGQEQTGGEGTVTGIVTATDVSSAEPEQTEPVIVPMLVNTEYVMSADFVPVNLVDIGDESIGTPSLQINATVLEAYKVMLEDLKASGVKKPLIISAYRSYSRQKQLYDAKVAQYGEGQKVTAKPGTSEHQYSACVDISTDGTCQNDFGETETGKWIAENSYKYGFAVRYPSNKKEYTGINFEPWHLRFVGVEHATRMHKLDMCLEEYVSYLRATYTNTVDEQSPDDFPVPRFAGDTGD